MRKLTVLDLYAGIGRCSEPFKRWNRVGTIGRLDSSQYARKVYQKNWPKALYGSCDLSNTSARRISSFIGQKVDVLLGCPPCQGFSDCGSRANDDPRNNHVSRFRRLVFELKPLVLAMENVPLAAASPKFNLLTRELEAAGYVWCYSIANAALWGSCQTRQRLILVAAKKELHSDLIFPSPTHGGKRRYYSYREGLRRKIEEDPVSILGTAPASSRIAKAKESKQVFGGEPIPTVGEVLSGLPKLGTATAAAIGHKPWNHSKKLLRRMQNVEEGGRWKGGQDHFSQAYGRLHRQGLSRTITGFFPNAGSGRFWHPTENRALTLREAARIQGLPDSFKFLEEDRNNCILVGNALDNALAQTTFQLIRQLLE